MEKIIFMKIVLTGFGPFGNWKANPSFETVKKFDGKMIHSYMIESVEIPVVYKKVPEIIENLFIDDPPDIVIMTGIAEGISCIQLERIAINEATARIAYQDGSQPMDEKIVSD